MNETFHSILGGGPAVGFNTLDTNKVNKNGTKEITIQNCQFFKPGKNIFDKSAITSGKFVNQTTGELGNNSSFFASNFIKIEPSTPYTISAQNARITGLRYALYTSKDESTFIEGDLAGSVTALTFSTGSTANYMRFSFYLTGLDQLQLEKGIAATTYTPYEVVLEDDLIPTITNPGYVRYIGTLSNGQTLGNDFINNIKKNNIYDFMCAVTSFDSLKIGHGSTAYESSFITIDSTKVTYTEYTPTISTEEWNHSLTISEYLHVLIVVNDGEAKLTIDTNDGSFSQTIPWNGCSNSSPYVSSINSVLSDCIFTWASPDLQKDIWYFGDSYVNFRNSNRWTYYLKQNGWLKNILLNGFGGEGTPNAMTSLQNALKVSKPKKIVWALGMNDGSDSENSPSTTWKNGIDTLIQICNDNNIELIMCTIPTVPTINNEEKNAFIRSSGYRYIDFALAVGADSSGNWYSGMLSSDNVHPDVAGAKALFTRAIADVPELTYENH